MNARCFNTITLTFTTIGFSLLLAGTISFVRWKAHDALQVEVKVPRTIPAGKSIDAFIVFYNSDRDFIEILGLNSQCQADGCLRVDPPIDRLILSPGESRSIPVSIAVKRGSPTYELNIQIFFTSQGQTTRSLDIRIRGSRSDYLTILAKGGPQ